MGPDPLSYPYAVYPATAVTDLAAVDASVTAMEAQVQTIRRRLQEELDAIPKAKVSFRAQWTPRARSRALLGCGLAMNANFSVTLRSQNRCGKYSSNQGRGATKITCI